ncbi:putative RNA-directed DNA polymerase from transposon BS [Trichonephila clavipes]|nr:putative RNA-directed DNA polymerase from transposon BS [Trichonephila clavipes]
MWDSSGINSRGVYLLNIVDDKGFVFLNDGLSTHYSHSYNSKKALHVTIISPDLSPACNWKVLENIGSDHLPILFELNKRQTTYKISNSLDSRSSNSKLWKLVKGVSKEQPQFGKCNTIQSTDGLFAQNDEQAINILGEHYQLISSLNFTGNNKYVKSMVSNVVYGCRSNPHVGPAIFSRAFSAQELDATILGIEKVIPNDCEIGIFADDIVLWSFGSDTEKVEESVNLALADVIFLNSQPLEKEKHPRYLGFILDPEILSNRHLEHLALRARKCIKILKYISGHDWGADAGTLRNTYVCLIRPILEYCFPIFCCSSDSNFQKLERVQLSAARIITGLRNSCPKDIVLYEADLQPLSLRRNACLVKYYSKLSSLGFQNRASKFLRSRSNRQRLKRGSPFGRVASGHLVSSSIEHHSLSQIIDPSEGLDGVYFQVDLSIQVSKQKELPCYLKQLTLERINNVPKDAVHM